MKYIGIDPGLNGGIAIIDQDNNVKLCVPMPVKNGEVDVRTLAVYIQNAIKESPTFAILEKVGAMPGQGVCAMFTFGQVVGEIKATLKMLKCPFEEVTPQKWKKCVLEGLPWKATISKFVAPENADENTIAELKKIHNRSKASAKKDAKLVACKYIEKRFPDVDLYKGKKNPHDGMAESLCMAVYAKQNC